MTTDTAQETSTEAPQPKYITEADFRAFQAAKDREIAEERQLADEAFGKLREMEAAVEELRQRGYENDDPATVKALKERDAALRELRDLKGLVARWGPPYKNALIRAESLDMADGNRTKAAEYAKILETGRTEAQVLQLAKQLRESLGANTPTPPPPPQRDEIDLGRGSGRAGAPRLSIAGMRESRSWEPAERAAYMKRIDDALRRGEELPAK